jgi:hypothetical protein
VHMEPWKCPTSDLPAALTLWMACPSSQTQTLGDRLPPGSELLAGHEQDQGSPCLFPTVTEPAVTHMEWSRHTGGSLSHEPIPQQRHSHSHMKDTP